MIFEKRKSKKTWIIPYLVFAAVAGAIFFNAGSFSENSDNEAKENLTETVQKMAVHCYAIEGRILKTQSIWKIITVLATTTADILCIMSL